MYNAALSCGEPCANTVATPKYAEYDTAPAAAKDVCMNPDDTQILARWITQLRAENAGLRRENEWHKETLARRWDRIRHLERRVGQLDNRLHRFWMDTYTPEQARELAAELV